MRRRVGCSSGASFFNLKAVWSQYVNAHEQVVPSKVGSQADEYAQINADSDRKASSGLKIRTL